MVGAAGQRVVNGYEWWLRVSDDLMVCYAL